MLTYFKINSEQHLEWEDDHQDLCTFIVVIARVEHEFGVSTYLLCNRKQSIVSSKFNVLGLSTIKVVSQFDIKTETGAVSLKEGMPVIGLNSLRAFLEAKHKRPFTCAALK